MKIGRTCLAVVAGTFLFVEAATAAPAKPVEYCASLGASVSQDPDVNWNGIFDMHARGCWEYWGTWKPAYVQNENSACNIMAYKLAERGLSTAQVEARVTHGGRCFQFEDGTYGKVK